MWMGAQVAERGVICLGRKGRNCSRDHHVRDARPLWSARRRSATRSLGRLRRPNVEAANKLDMSTSQHVYMRCKGYYDIPPEYRD